MRAKRLWGKAVISLIVFLCFTTKGDLIFDSGYNVFDESYGYYDEVSVINDAILDVMGGEAGKLETRGTATANLYSCDIDWLWTYDNSIANIYEGDIDWLAAYGNSSINLYAYDVIYHSTGGGGGNDPWLEGNYYSDNSYFSVWLYYQAYQHINIVPEPATFLLFCAGAVLLRRKH
ncbi:MAG: PEP-CTERM sorting domain-containing protein [Sedimentisphaerales bacterium]|nr:PEP-CTERM sorting domain-containing protein [Sedimentisphaerales bacterium]